MRTVLASAFALGETGGYANKADAKAELAKIRCDESICKGVVE